MKIYFIRHAITELGSQQIYQYDDTPLSDTGLGQAKSVARQLATISIDKLISSPLLRAIQTAQEIATNQNIELIQSHLFIERRQPISIIGKKRDDPNVLRVKNLLERSKKNTQFIYEDAENFYHLRDRAKKALKYIKQLDCDTLAIVTHGVFFTFLAAEMLLQDQDILETYDNFYHFFQLSNAGITLIEFKNLNWYLKYWNETNHLTIIT